MDNWKKLALGLVSVTVALFSISFALSDIWFVDSEGMSKVIGSTELGWSYLSKRNYLLSASIPLLLGAALVVCVVRFLRNADKVSRYATLVGTGLLLSYFLAMHLLAR